MATIFFSCATPVAPTGGPADKTGPKIENTSPETGSVNFEERKVSFEFSEFVNRSSFETELNIEPDLGIEYEVKWRRKTATVEFKNDLPDSTTIIITVGGNTTDTRSNKMGAPVQLAVSTGDEIDEGEITGSLKNAETGKAQSAVKILLYRSPFDLSKPANYSSEPDTGGVFRFGYLREGRYKAFALDDRNRNKIWDRTNETARPLNKEFVALSKGGKDTLDVTYWFEQDTLKPKLQAVGLLSSQRLRLRFGEEVRFTPQTSISIKDSAGNDLTTAFPLYVPVEDPFLAFAYVREPLKENSSYRLSFSGITDPSGNEAIGLDNTFLGSDQEDTVSQDILAFNGENGLFPNQSLEVEFIKPIAQQEIIDSTVVIEGDVDFKNWPNITVQDNKLTIPPQQNWLEGVDYKFLVWNPKSRKRQLIDPNIWNPVNFGGIEIDVTASDSTKAFRLHLYDDKNTFSIDSTFSNFISLEDIPPIKYTLVLFQDMNGNGIWDYGAVDPYIKPEPYYIQQNINIQRGFTSEVKIDFR
ncbi:MAG: Ig-like domain-containing protein [Balneola sp.]